VVNDSQLTDYEEKILSNVEEFGCFVTTVFDPEGESPSYSYSTGFTASLNQGEVIIFGLDHDVMHRAVNIVRDQCREGLVLTDWQTIGGVLEGFDVVARIIPKRRIDREHFNSARWFHRRRFGAELAEAYQLVWPGAVDGLYPWDDGCAAIVADLQPALYERGTVL
jgi:hypothetical protein